MLGDPSPEFGGTVALSGAMLLNCLTLLFILSNPKVGMFSPQLSSLWGILVAFVVLCLNYIYSRAAGGIESINEYWESQPESLIKRGRIISLSYFYGTPER